MSDLSKEEFEKLKREVDQAHAESERAKGARDQLMRRLHDEFECDSLEEARTLLKKIQRQKDEAMKTFDEKMSDYRRKWKK